MRNADLREVVEIARQRGDDWIDAMNDVFAPDGLTYWDRAFKTDADFLAWHVYQSTYPSPEFNVLGFLQEMGQTNPDVAKLWDEIERRYQRATAKMIGVTAAGGAM